MTEENPKISDITELEEKTSSRLGALMDNNHQLMQINRKQAKEMERLATIYEAMADNCLEISEMLARQAAVTAGVTYDIIRTEWGLTSDDETDDETEDEDEEPDCD